MVSRAFKITSGFVLAFGISTCISLGTFLSMILIGEGGDALGPVGMLAFTAMIAFFILFLISVFVAFGLWAVRENDSE